MLMHLPRLIATAAAGLAVFGLAATAPALAAAAPSAPRAHQINLHAAYEAHLGHTKPGRIAGIVYARGKQPKAANVKASCTEPNCPLVYNGGSVQHSPQVYLLFWGPTWSTDSGEQASMSYLENLCNGLGVQSQDSWSTITDQYTDSTGHPSFNGTACKGFFQDTTTPPTGVDQFKLAAEADAFTSTQGITDTADAQIVIATQSGTCPQGFYSPNCNGGTGKYCAWHSSSNEPYTNLPYILDAGSGCGEDFVNSTGTHDGFSIVGGHEYAETITDPFPDSGWWDPSDSSGGEIGDKCAWSSLSSNVTLSTGSFAMQPLYSNAGFAANGQGCVMSMPQGGGNVTLTVTKSGTGAGTGAVSSNPAGISCPGTCSASFSPGTPVTLTATPPAGGVFTGWTGPCHGMASNTCTFTVNSNTSVGTSFTASATLTQENGAGVSYTGTWKVSNCQCFSGGHTLYSTTKGNNATFKFTGNLVQFVSEKSPTRGSVKVYMDGTYKATVNNYRTFTRNAIIVWQESFATVGEHTLKIVNLGTSGHPRIDVDTFVVAT